MSDTTAVPLDEARAPAPTPPSDDTPSPDPSSERRWAAAVLAVLALAAITRLVGLGLVDRIAFDEKYYVNDARAYVEQGVEEERPAHPPIGKLPIAAGIALVGDEPVGWRTGPALAGVATVALTMAMARRLTRRRGSVVLAGLLVAVDGLALAMSRIGMLDATLGLCIALAAWLLLVDRDRRRAGLVRLLSWPRLGAGVALGLALGTKWYSLLTIAAAGLLLVVAELRAHDPATGSMPRLTRRVGRGALVVAVVLVVIPLCVYVASYAGWAANYQQSEVGRDRCPPDSCVATPGEIAGGWLREQSEMADLHRTLEATHDYRAPAWTWAADSRPVLVYLERCDRPEDRLEGCDVPEGTKARASSIGNPVLWWGGVLAVAVLAWRGVRRRDADAGFVLAFIALQFFPWLAAWRPVFNFYALPLVPFLAIAVAMALDRSGGRGGTAARIGVGVVAVGFFLFLLPVLIGWPLSPGQSDLRMLLPTWA